MMYADDVDAIEEWRRKQPIPTPSRSEAIKQLVRLGLRRRGNDGERRQTKNGSMVIQTTARADQACRGVAIARNDRQSHEAANSHNSEEGCPVGHFDQTREG